MEQPREMADQESDIVMGDNGRPTKNGTKKANHVYPERAQKTDAGYVARSLHYKFKSSDVWLWRGVDIEYYFGLFDSKKPAEWSRFCLLIEVDAGNAVIRDPGKVRTFVCWVRKQGMRT